MNVDWNKVGQVVKAGVKIASAVIDAVGDYADDGKRNHSNKKQPSAE